MKILIVHDYGAALGGADQLSVALRDLLRDYGHDARLFASSARPAPVENAADYICFGTLSSARNLLQLANPWALHKLRRVIERFRPDVAHVCIYTTQLSPLVLPALRGVPSLLHVHNYDQTCPTNSKLLPNGRLCNHRPGWVCRREGCLGAKGLARFVVQRHLTERWSGVFGTVVAPSDWVARRLRAEGQRVDETIWNGVPRSEVRPPLSAPPTIAYAGRLVPKKGVDTLLRAMALVVRRLPAARLLIAGDGPERASLERLMIELGLGTRVEFLGHLQRSAMERALSRAWVQAVPSRWEEPFGLVAAEAMMRGTAVVASRLGGLSEFVVDGVTGYGVPPGDASTLAETLLRVLSDRKLAELLGETARRFALAELTELRFTERFIDLYQRLAPR